jgi:hypothetical protein
LTETQNPEAETQGKSELLRSRGRLARGLSALFWGLPISLVCCVETAKMGWLRSFGFIPVLAATGLLLFGLWQMSGFQKKELSWRNALDRAKLSGLVNFGLCPFLYWHNRMPREMFFSAAVFALVLSAIFFLFNLNVVLKRLGAILPDEPLRQETLLFTALNRWLLGFLFCGCIAYVVLLHVSRMPLEFGILIVWLDRLGLWLLTFFALLPLAMTMALIWKTKETVFDIVFGAK